MEERHDWYAVRNAEGQYSVWQNHMPVPAGWAPVHRAHTKEDCLEYIGRTWTDIRPVSSR
ncbi:MbtH family NRPS accessory protein [Streptomyces sp. LaPpAH-108]|uniref:MbtH family NRPS accessory protein n=1 Tax=Streptomyces sp. LaPpAH-108 TaxID=1155714 RepID=UPI00037905D8|nr:MbtH family NRPS accessory protein [Streptomyces sp. LaPpAH-108]